jgi:hypothetical protein
MMAMHIFDVSSVDQIDFEAFLFQQLVKRDPVDSGRFHRYRSNFAFSQPLDDGSQILGEGTKTTNVHFQPVWRYRDIDLGSANIGAPGIGVVDPKHAIVLGLGAFAFDMLFLGQKLFFALHSFSGPSMGSWPERRKKSGHSAKTGSLARQAANPGE